MPLCFLYTFAVLKVNTVYVFFINFYGSNVLNYMENYIKIIEKLTVQKLYDDRGILIDATKKIV